MLDFRIQLVNVFQTPLENDYITPSPTISFAVLSPDFIQWNEHRIDSPGSHLAIVPGNTRLRTRYTGMRRNWAAVLETEDIRASETPGLIDIRSQNEWIRIPWHIPIEPAFISSLDLEWEHIRIAHSGGLPDEALRARMGIVNQIKRLFDYQMPQSGEAPTARLKRLIDEDTQMQCDLGSLSQQCGFTADHLRVLFKQAYGTTPQRYRNRRRMSLAMELIGNSRLSIKEIGVQTGCRHMSHFTSLFRKEFGMAPTEAVAKFRHGY